ncbi:hypothetical protein PRIPAC_86054 [Pristionchus pacificus]|uniref:Uncharacterized protein n=1 Tax=Pristionchus pacificus TaxID=54126 RepID=A0A2A6BNT2_PRIPA|nr:hypothetical protein PRIPAC_86054 [Pristionchus pacificus]|eukprot:PDM67443.1 hypothetical protein PRIPAC_48860 [Pristionchus pacificus]
MFWQAVHAMQMCVCCCCEALPPDEYTETEEEESRRESESCADITAPPVYTLHDPVFLAQLKHATNKEEKAALLLEKKKRELLLGRILLERECGL